MRHPPATPVGSPTDGAPVGPPGTSSPPLGETVAQSSARHPTAVTGRRGGAVTAGRLGGAGGDPVAAGLEGQCALLTPASARNPAPGKLFRAFSRACAGGLFALKPGSCPGWRTFSKAPPVRSTKAAKPLDDRCSRARQ